jgi:hypothetical protein
MDIKVTRRSFVGGIAAAAAVPDMAAASIAGDKPFVWAQLVHLSSNMWGNDGLSPETVEDGEAVISKTLRCDDAVWKRVVDAVAASGANTLVIDVGDGLSYPSHPELAIEGSWPAEKLAAEVARIRSLGLEVVPKLNFSTTHNGWMKHYHRMISTNPYYRMCEDVIKDVAEVFEHPRFLHIGYDEERAEEQIKFHGHRIVIARLKELWDHDFLHIVRTSEKNGMRPWAWADHGWFNPSFYDFCPKSVVLSNWFYDVKFGGFEISKNDTEDKKVLQCFYELDKRGFDQIPCGSTWASMARRRAKVGADDVMGKLVKLCRRDLKQEHVLGYLMAPWASCDTEENLKKNLRAIDLLAEAMV